MSGDALDALAAEAGILDRYRDLSAVEHVAPPESKRALLSAMGFDADAAGEVLVRRRAEAAARPLPPAVVVRAGEVVRIGCARPEADWYLAPDPRTALSPLAGRARAGEIDLPVLPVGLHVILVGDHRTLVVAAPDTAPDLASLGLVAPRWGVTAALYGLRSDRNLGIGTYGDLAVAAEAMAPQGADFIGINPVHALGVASATISPYSPTHRGFLNTDHITPPGDFGDGEAIALGAGGQIDYPASRAAQQGRLRAAYAALDPSAAAALQLYRARAGAALEDFATFEALSLVHGADWRRWPEALRRSTSRTTRRFAAENAVEIGYHAYLQWLAETELADAHDRARAAGMALGLYVDLAIGVRPDGGEVWAEPGAFARGVSLGAPPDQFNSAGQVWGLAPMSPIGLASDLYRPFVDTVRAAVRHAGIARIDHVLGFMRCFWVPQDGAPGAYVRYPSEVLLAITKVEAAHAGCLVIGEDLGVLPEGLRERLSESRLYGCAVAQFERGEDEDLRHPDTYRPATLASFATHDTPTVRGFWSGWEIERKVGFGQIDGDAADAARQRRDWDRRRLFWLAEAGTGEPTADLDVEGVARLHTLLADAASELIAVQIDDAFARLEQPNFPGTVDEYPNWRLKCPVTVDELRHVPALEPVQRRVKARRDGSQ